MVGEKEFQCGYLWEQFDNVKRCTHDRNAQPNMKLDGETPGFCIEDKCPLKDEKECENCLKLARKCLKLRAEIDALERRNDELEDEIQSIKDDPSELFENYAGELD